MAIILYSLGGIWGALTFAFTAREGGLRLASRDGLELASLAFLLWPLIAAQMLFVSVRIYQSYQRNRLARLRRRV